MHGGMLTCKDDERITQEEKSKNNPQSFFTVSEENNKTLKIILPFCPAILLYSIVSTQNRESQKVWILMMTLFFLVTFDLGLLKFSCY